MIYVLILVFAVLPALAKFGIQTASFVAILGAAGFAVGFVLQGSLANFAAGVLILGLRPFKMGDYIIGAGEAGTVKEISLFTTVLSTPDNVKILIPNLKSAVRAQTRPLFDMKERKCFILLEVLLNFVILLGLLVILAVTFALAAMATSLTGTIVDWLALDEVPPRHQFSAAYCGPHSVGHCRMGYVRVPL